MSKYTTEVRYICESKSGLRESKGCDDVDQIIANSWNKIFTTTAETFDPTYKPIICSKILKHYYLREIGAETVGIWKLWMNTKFEETVGYYNKLWESAALEFNPLYDVDLKRTHNRNVDNTENKTTDTTSNVSGKTSETTDTTTTDKGTTTGETDRTGSGTNENKTTTDNTITGSDSRENSSSSSETKYDLYSDTPQGALTGVESETYLTNARKQTDSFSGSGNESGSSTETTKGTTDGNGSYSDTEKTTTSGSSTNNGTVNTVKDGTNSSDTTTKDEMTGSANTIENFTETVIGKQGTQSYSSMIKEFRETFMNIDMMFIEEFEELFMGLW